MFTSCTCQSQLQSADVCVCRSLCTAAPHLKNFFDVRGGCTQATFVAHRYKIEVMKICFFGLFFDTFPPNTRTRFFTFNVNNLHKKQNKKSLHSGYSLTYFSQTSNCFDIRKKRDSPVSLYSKITCGLLSVKTRKTQYSRATHDPQPKTHDP